MARLLTLALTSTLLQNGASLGYGRHDGGEEWLPAIKSLPTFTGLAASAGRAPTSTSLDAGIACPPCPCPARLRLSAGLFFVSALFALTATPSVALAQVPPDIVEGIRKIGPIVDAPGTAKLYAPLFANQKEPYPNVTVVPDIAYGTDPLQKLDVFTPAPTPGAPKPVVMYLHSGGFQRGDKHPAGSPFYDNIMLWLTRQDMVGVNINYRLAPKHVWPAAHEDLAAAVRWIQANIVQYGGDPDRLVLWGQSAGADLIADYLAHPQFHGPKGHGAKAAIMLSGFYDYRGGAPAYFGNDPAELEIRASTEALKKVTIPLFVSHTEVDLPESIKQADALNKALCDAGRCPTYTVFKDHSHLSQSYSVGTTDTSVSGPILEVLRKVK